MSEILTNPCENHPVDDDSFRRCVLRVLPLVRQQEIVGSSELLGVCFPVRVETIEDQQTAVNLAIDCARKIYRGECPSHEYSEIDTPERFSFSITSKSQCEEGDNPDV